MQEGDRVAMTPEEVFKELDLQDTIDNMGEKREICYQGCSAKTGEGIWEGIGKLQEIMDNYHKASGNTS